VRVTKRTERIRIAGVAAAALVALVLGGCGDAAEGAKTAVADEPVAAQQSTNVDAAPAADLTTAPASPAVSATPQVTTKTVNETKSIGYASRTVKDSSLAKGVKKTRTKGVAGIQTLTYRVTYTDGVQTSKTLVKSVVTRAPVTKVVAVGTKASASSKCDPNYSGCVPIASDVDCAGGSGNGPAYVSGPVHVIGDDIYDLDRDGDGVACDS
jgi:hypothetical protein